MTAQTASQATERDGQLEGEHVLPSSQLVLAARLGLIKPRPKAYPEPK